MVRIIIAGSSESGRRRLSGILASSGFEVFRQCSSGGELRRAVSDIEDGIVIYLGILQDCQPETLRQDHGDRIRILMIAKPEILYRCEDPEVFKLPLPSSAQAISGALAMLAQMHRMTLPKREGTDRQTVEKAKSILMERNGLSEPQAHRLIQRYAMDHGIRMKDFAEKIIRDHAGEN